MMGGQSMRQETVGVTENLLKSATEEFLEKGFMKASLRNISAKSGVSTNSIYTRFKDKEGLFSAIVKETADGLMDIYLGVFKKQLIVLILIKLIMKERKAQILF